jgi:hypothetical protein
MEIGKDEVVEVLSDYRIPWIRFSAGPINVNVEEYERVANFVGSGAIKVKTTDEAYNFYRPQTNTLFFRKGDPVGDLAARTSVLHECTHVIADINKVRVTRLHDEAAAYLAEFSFLMQLDPNFVALPVRGDPVYDLMRVGIDMVAKYKLGEPAGSGATISQSDISDLGMYVHRHPEYSKIKDGEQLAADGVDLTDDQAAIYHAMMSAKLHDKLKYENWLLSTVTTAQTGTGMQKSSAYQQLQQHFFMVYLPTATVLLQRLSGVKKGDALSERFDRFSAQEKYELLQALRVPKPER